MLAQHRVDVQRPANILGRIDGADFDMRALVSGVDLLEIGAGCRKNLAARDRVAGNAAAEIVDAAGDLFFLAFAEEVDRRCWSRMLAISQILPTLTLTCAPTCPAIATAESLDEDNLPIAAASSRTREADPEISTTSPIIRSSRWWLVAGATGAATPPPASRTCCAAVKSPALNPPPCMSMYPPRLLWSRVGYRR
jgi:hypothetical protein